MIERVVLVTTLTMIGLGAVLLLVLAVRSAWTANREQRRRPVIDAARAVLVEVSTRDEPPRSDELDALRRLTAREADDLFCHTAVAFSGVTHTRLAQLADEAGVLGRARRQLTDRRWWRRLDAAATLRALGDAPTVGDDLADDPHPAVRIQAIEWWLAHPSDRSVRRLTQMLDDPDGRCVFAAQTALLQVEHPVDDALMRAFAHDRGTSTRPLVTVAARLASGRMLPALEAYAHHDDPEIRAEVARAFSTHDDARRLTALAADPDPSVRAAAMRSIGATGALTQAPVLRRGLDDEYFEVRRAAAFGLARLGAAGNIALRTAATERDELAGQMASRVLSQLAWEREEAL